MSLRLRLTAAITLVLLLTLAIGSVFTYWHAVDKVETEMRAAIAVGGRIAQNAVDDVEEVSNPRRRLELLVADFDGDRHLRAILMTPGGHISVTSDLPPPTEGAPDWLFEMLGATTHRVQVALPALFDGHGRIHLEADPRNEVAELWNDVKLYFSILTLFCLLVLLLSLFAVGRILEPLTGLRSAFDRIGRGDYLARVNPRGPPELAGLCSGFNSMGERLHDMEMNNRRLHNQLETVQEEERAELARDLHDEVSPLLFSVDVDATMIKQFAGDEGGRDKIVERSNAIREAASQMKRHVKSILGRLRPAVLLDLGLGPALENLAGSWRGRNPDIAFNISMPRSTWGPALDSVLHYVIRESVANALRHGSPSKIDIVLTEREGTTLDLEITDDGVGLRQTSEFAGFGITGMKERALRMGGVLTVENGPGGTGVTVKAILPLGELAGAPDADEIPEARAA